MTSARKILNSSQHHMGRIGSPSYSTADPLSCRRNITRRALLKSAAAAFPVILPSSVLGLDAAVSPSNRIALGFIGIGAMGQGHLGCCLQYPAVQVVGVCNVDRWRRETAKSAAEQAYASLKSSGAYRGCTAHVDLRELIGRSDVNAVVIATGDRWHAAATILAAEAGKDIYCEKPCALTPREARAMIDTVRRYDRVFQAGLQQRSDPTFRKACSLVLAGGLGKIRFVYVGFPGTSDDVHLAAEPVPEGLDWDLWLGPAPWRPFHHAFHAYGRPPGVVPWHFCRDFGGGNLTSNAVHAFDVVQWGLGMDQSGPLEIIPPETGRYPSLTYKYAGDVLLQVTWRLEPGKHFIPPGWDTSTTIEPFGAVFVGERGWIHVGRSGYLKWAPADVVQGLAGRMGETGVVGHHEDWFDAIRTRRRPACDVEQGCRSTMVAHLGCIAHWTARALKWDPAHEIFPNDDGANRWLSRAMRSPWTL